MKFFFLFFALIASTIAISCYSRKAYGNTKTTIIKDMKFCYALFSADGRMYSFNGMNSDPMGFHGLIWHDEAKDVCQLKMSSTDRVLCQVCGDVAQRNYNGVQVCDACRVFFLDYKKIQQKLICKKENCIITVKNRKKSCHFCRFEKCKSLGMDKKKIVAQVLTPEKLAPQLTQTMENQLHQCTENDESELQKIVEQLTLQDEAPEKITQQAASQAHTSQELSPEHTLGELIEITGNKSSDSSKAKKPDLGGRKTKQCAPAVTQSSLPVQDQQKIALKPTPKEVKKRIQKIFQLYDRFCSYTSEKTKATVQKDFGWNYNRTINVNSNRVSAWVHYSGLINNDLDLLLKFVAGLHMTLDTDCLKYMFWKQAFVLLFAWVARGISNNGFQMGEGQFVPEEVFFLLYGRDVAKKMIDLADEIRGLQFTDHDMAMCIVFLFFQPLEENDPLVGRVNPEEYDELRNAFKQYESTEKLRFQEVAKLIPKLNELHELYKKEVGSYVMENKDYFPAGDLFDAMFIDVPEQ
ncbi:hypothetical protein CAEBREN_10272 [Caenorhabditis brenneri]|uniref:Nuclear receptor domain-containing protein n=1 Tax=Caenorhabditis brenneri TaxID=135651 RepID=G0MWG1_CAEBE|nr:hypothetical protein CAEBREN_10272 [Caenorhabditis brenneri]